MPLSGRVNELRGLVDMPAFDHAGDFDYVPNVRQRIGIENDEVRQLFRFQHQGSERSRRQHQQLILTPTSKGQHSVAAGHQDDRQDQREEVTSQLRHSLLLQGDPPSGKLLIPLSTARPERALFFDRRVEGRDVRVVEGARLEIALTVCDGVLQISITVAKPTS